MSDSDTDSTPVDDSDVWGTQPKRSITEIINDPDIDPEEKYKLAMAHNVCLSEYCHIMRDSLASIVSACNRHIVRLSTNRLTSAAEMQKMFFDIGTAASAAGRAKAPSKSERDPEGRPPAVKVDLTTEN